jgi:hypothetical protein
MCCSYPSGKPIDGSDVPAACGGSGSSHIPVVVPAVKKAPVRKSKEERDCEAVSRCCHSHASSY